jgi:hypothetical protein
MGRTETTKASSASNCSSVTQRTNAPIDDEDDEGDEDDDGEEEDIEEDLGDENENVPFDLFFDRDGGLTIAVDDVDDDDDDDFGCNESGIECASIAVQASNTRHTLGSTKSGAGDPSPDETHHDDFDWLCICGKG